MGPPGLFFCFLAGVECANSERPLATSTNAIMDAQSTRREIVLFTPSLYWFCVKYLFLGRWWKEKAFWEEEK